MNSARASSLAERAWRVRGRCRLQPIAFSAAQPRCGAKWESPCWAARKPAAFGPDRTPPSSGGVASLAARSHRLRRHLCPGRHPRDHQLGKHRLGRHALGHDKLPRPQLPSPVIDLPARRPMPLRNIHHRRRGAPGFPPQSAPAPPSCAASARTAPRSPQAEKPYRPLGRPDERPLRRLVPSPNPHRLCTPRLTRSDHQPQEVGGGGVALADPEGVCEVVDRFYARQLAGIDARRQYPAGTDHEPTGANRRRQIAIGCKNSWWTRLCSFS